MHTFKDTTGREWRIELTVGAVKRVRADVGIDLLGAAGGGLVKRLSEDPVALCDVLYVLCRPQADADKITDEGFGRAMAGDVFDAAAAALWEELVDFFPRHRRALAIREVLETAKAAVSAVAVLGQEMSATGQGAGGDSSGVPPAPSGSTPTP